MTRTVPAGAVATSTAPAVGAVVGGEEQRPAHLGQEVGPEA